MIRLLESMSIVFFTPPSPVEKSIVFLAGFGISAFCYKLLCIFMFFNFYKIIKSSGFYNLISKDIGIS